MKVEPEFQLELIKNEKGFKILLSLTIRSLLASMAPPLAGNLALLSFTFAI